MKLDTTDWVLMVLCAIALVSVWVAGLTNLLLVLR
jgi:hypothetical protein